MHTRLQAVSDANPAEVENYDSLFATLTEHNENHGCIGY